jgi:hypothetical protein
MKWLARKRSRIELSATIKLPLATDSNGCTTGISPDIPLNGSFLESYSALSAQSGPSPS